MSRAAVERTGAAQLLLQLLLVIGNRAPAVHGCQLGSVKQQTRFERIPESLPPGAQALVFRAQHAGSLTLSPASQEADFTSYFRPELLANGTAALVVSGDLTALGQRSPPVSVVRLRVLCAGSTHLLGAGDGAGDGTDDGEQQQSLPVTLYIEDVNDHAPQFVGTPYQTIVNELTPAGVVIFDKILARDQDKPNTANSAVHYWISGGNERLQFALSPLQEGGASVVLEEPLDFERGDRMITLIISASDGGSPVRVSKTRLTITVEDGDDQPPQFTSAVYRATVTEYPGPQMRTIRLQLRPSPPLLAYDGDLALDRPVVYSLRSAAAGWQRHFSIDAATGALTLVTTFDRERLPRNEITLTVEATETAEAQPGPSRAGPARPTATATLLITVTDLNDNAPQFQVDRYNISIMENLLNGFSIVQLVATDADEGANAQFRYRLEDESGSAAFRVDPVSGWLTVADQTRLDRETRPQVALTVHADETTPNLLRGGTTSSTHVLITLLDSNDNSPRFQPSNTYQFLVMANHSVGRDIGQVVATDEDQDGNGRVTYSLENTTVADALSAFSVNTHTGIVHQHHPLPPGSYVLFVRAEDAPENAAERRSALAVVSVLVRRQNLRPPRIPTGQRLWVGSDPAPGSTAGQLLAADPDGDPLTFHLRNHSVPFDIDSGTGYVTVTRALEQSHYVLGVDVTDGTHLATSMIEVNVVTNTTEQLFHSNAREFYVEENMENLTLGVLLESPVTSGSGVVGDVTGRILQPDMRDVFVLRDKAELVLLSSLDFEEVRRLSFTAILEFRDTSGTRHVHAVAVTVHVQDRNDHPPRFSSAQYRAALPASAGKLWTGALQVTPEVRLSDVDSVRTEFRLSVGDRNPRRDRGPDVEAVAVWEQTHQDGVGYDGSRHRPGGVPTAADFSSTENTDMFMVKSVRTNGQNVNITEEQQSAPRPVLRGADKHDAESMLQNESNSDNDECAAVFQIDNSAVISVRNGVVFNKVQYLCRLVVVDADGLASSTNLVVDIEHWESEADDPGHQDVSGRPGKVYFEAKGDEHTRGMTKLMRDQEKEDAFFRERNILPNRGREDTLDEQMAKLSELTMFSSAATELGEQQLLAMPSIRVQEERLESKLDRNRSVFPVIPAVRLDSDRVTNGSVTVNIPSRTASSSRTGTSAQTHFPQQARSLVDAWEELTPMLHPTTGQDRHSQLVRAAVTVPVGLPSGTTVYRLPETIQLQALSMAGDDQGTTGDRSSGEVRVNQAREIWTEGASFRVQEAGAKHFFVDFPSHIVRVADPMTSKGKLLVRIQAQQDDNSREDVVLLMVDAVPLEIPRILRYNLFSEVEEGEYSDFRVGSVTLEESFEGVLYSIVDANTTYRISQNGDIYISGTIDFEQDEKLNIPVQVCPQMCFDILSRLPLEGSLVDECEFSCDRVNFTLHITDVNDHKPTFLAMSDIVNVSGDFEDEPEPPYALYRLQMRTQISGGEQVGVVAAQDADKDSIINGAVRYQTVPPEREDFRVDPMSGVITAVKDMSGIAGAVRRLTIVAHDLGSPRRKSFAVMQMMFSDGFNGYEHDENAVDHDYDKNDNAMSQSSTYNDGEKEKVDANEQKRLGRIFDRRMYTAEVQEQEAGSIALVPVPWHLNTGGLVRKEWTVQVLNKTGLEDTQYTVVNNSLLKIEGTLDFETSPNVWLLVSLHEEVAHYSSMEELKPEQEVNTKKLPKNNSRVLEFSVTPEKPVSGTSKLNKRAAKLTYRFSKPASKNIAPPHQTDSEPDERISTVAKVPSSGAVSNTARTARRELTASQLAYNQAILRLRVHDVNEHAPSFARWLQASAPGAGGRAIAAVPHDADYGYPVIQLQAEDEDAADPLTYSITSSQSDAATLYSIDSDTGQIWLLRRADQSAQRMHHLEVVAMDTANHTALLPLLVYVLDPEDMLILTVSQPTSVVQRHRHHITSVLSAATEHPVRVVRVQPSASRPEDGAEDTSHDDSASSDLWLYALHTSTGTLLSANYLMSRLSGSVVKFDTTSDALCDLDLAVTGVRPAPVRSREFLASLKFVIVGLSAAIFLLMLLTLVLLCCKSCPRDRKVSAYPALTISGYSSSAGPPPASRDSVLTASAVSATEFAVTGHRHVTSQRHVSTLPRYAARAEMVQRPPLAVLVQPAPSGRSRLLTTTEVSNGHYVADSSHLRSGALSLSPSRPAHQAGGTSLWRYHVSGTEQSFGGGEKLVGAERAFAEQRRFPSAETETSGGTRIPASGTNVRRQSVTDTLHDGTEVGVATMSFCSESPSDLLLQPESAAAANS